VTAPVQLFGWHSVRQALESPERHCHKLLLVQGNREAAELVRLARRKGVRIEFVQPRQLDRLAGGRNHQGAILLAAPPPQLSLEDALSGARPGPSTLWVGAAGILDPHNLGAILRNAACLGAGAVLLPERRTVPLTGAAEKVASGAVGRIPVVGVVNLNTAVLKLKEKGFWVYGADRSGRPVAEVEFQGPILLLIGSEDEGLREKTRGHCDGLVSIPQAPGGPQSLNAAAASAILIYEILRRISGSAAPGAASSASGRIGGSAVPGAGTSGPGRLKGPGGRN